MYCSTQNTWPLFLPLIWKSFKYTGCFFFYLCIFQLKSQSKFSFFPLKSVNLNWVFSESNGHLYQYTFKESLTLVIKRFNASLQFNLEDWVTLVITCFSEPPQGIFCHSTSALHQVTKRQAANKSQGKVHFLFHLKKFKEFLEICFFRSIRKKLIKNNLI